MKRKFFDRLPDLIGFGTLLAAVALDSWALVGVAVSIFLLAAMQRVEKLVLDLVKFHAFQAAMAKAIADGMEAKLQEQADAPPQE